MKKNYVEIEQKDMNFIGYALLKDKEKFLSDEEISFRELVETSVKRIDLEWEDILLDKISEFGYCYRANEEAPDTLTMLSRYIKISNADKEDILKKASNIYELVKGYITEISIIFAEKYGIDLEKREKLPEIIKKIYNGFIKYHNETGLEYLYVYEEELEFIKNNIIKKGLFTDT